MNCVVPSLPIILGLLSERTRVYIDRETQLYSRTDYTHTRARTHTPRTHTRTHTHARTYAHTRIHRHTHTQARTHSTYTCVTCKPKTTLLFDPSVSPYIVISCKFKSVLLLYNGFFYIFTLLHQLNIGKLGIYEIYVCRPGFCHWLQGYQVRHTTAEIIWFQTLCLHCSCKYSQHMEQKCSSRSNDQRKECFHDSQQHSCKWYIIYTKIRCVRLFHGQLVMCN